MSDDTVSNWHEIQNQVFNSFFFYYKNNRFNNFYIIIGIFSMGKSSFKEKRYESYRFYGRFT